MIFVEYLYGTTKSEMGTVASGSISRDTMTMCTIAIPQG